MKLKSQLINRDKIDCTIWDNFITNSPQQVAYAQSYYLDVVHPNWKAIFCYEGDKLLAVMPLCLKQKFFIKYIVKPSWTQYLGIFFCEMNEKNHRYYFIIKSVVQSIINTIPKEVTYFNYNFSPDYDGHLPFYWNKYKITPYHTYRLKLNISINEIYNDFSSSVKNSMKRAQKLKLKIIENNSIFELSTILQDRKIIKKYEKDKLIQLWDSLSKRNSCYTLYITNEQHDKIYCGGAFIIDQEKIIFLASGLNLLYKNTGAVSLMIWHALQKAKQIEQIKYFDFEGSMLMNVENYFRSFNAQALSYYNIQRSQFPMGLIKYFKDRLNI